MKKIFAELNAFRPELLCVLVSVAAGVGATLGLPTYLSDIINRGIADKDMNYILHTGHHAGNRRSGNGMQYYHRLFCLQNRAGLRAECEEQDFHKGGIFLPGGD